MKKLLTLALLACLMAISSFACDSGSSLQLHGDLPPTCNMLRILHNAPDEELGQILAGGHLMLETLQRSLTQGNSQPCTTHQDIFAQYGLDEAKEIFAHRFKGSDAGEINKTLKMYFKDTPPIYDETWTHYPHYRNEFEGDKLKKYKIGESIEAKDYFSEHQKEDILLAAQKIIAHTQIGDTLIFLGNTPQAICMTLEAIVNSRRIICLPFSGAPDFTKFRNFASSNIVSEGKLRFARQIMTEYGFDPLNFHALNPGKSYIIDLMESGKGLTSFLTFMAQWFKENAQPLPDFIFFNLANSVLPGLEIEEKEGKIKLSINENTSFEIRITHLGMHPTTITCLDRMEGAARFQPSFSANYWTENYRAVLSRYPTPYAQELDSILRDYAASQKTFC